MNNTKWYVNIMKSLCNDEYKDLGKISFLDNDVDNISNIKINIIPYEGVHKDIEYTLTLKYRTDDWPGIYVDSPLFDKIKTSRYLSNKGRAGEHKGICIEKLSYGYAFKKNFKLYCNDNWKSYVYYVISILNNIHEFEKGNGFRHDYKEILNIN